MIRFHCPGVPEGARKLGTLGCLPFLKEYGVDGIEIEFTHGVKMGDELAQQIGEKAKELDLTITVHGPFWINLNSVDRPKRHAGVSYIMQAVKKAHLMGAKSVTFHAAYMHGQESSEVLKNTKEMLGYALEEMDKLDIKDVRIAPELTGKESQFGSIDQLVELVNELDKKISLCIDFTHNYARTIGRANGREAFQEIIDKVRKGLGDEFLKNLHIHMGGMIYGPKGEKMHRVLPEEDEFEWQTLLKVLKENKVSGWATIETPDLEVSTKIAKDYYHSL